MEHPGEENFDPNLLALIKKSEQDGGISLKDVPKNSLAHIHTQNTTYIIAIIDNKSGKVAVTSNGKHVTRPEIGYLRGSTFGGSMIKVDWIGIGMHLEVALADGRILTTSPIKMVRFKADQQNARQTMIESAQSREPKPITKEEFLQNLEKFITEKFPENIRADAKQMIERFSLNGRMAIATVLAIAHEHDKFRKTMSILNRFYAEHWAYQHPEVRGDPGFTPSNAFYLERVYKEAGLPLPKRP